jgi:tetratricopeptide (TPR) repeat protein
MAPDQPAKQPVHPKMQQAVTATKEQRYDVALAHLKSIVADRPQDPVVLGMLASVYADLGMKDRAMEFYDRILELSPANPLARQQRGLLDFEGGQLENALEIWAPMLQTEHDFMAHFFSAMALMQLGRLEGTRGLLETALERMPADHPLQQEAEKLLMALSND